jgi:hypothetical protein
MSDPVGENYRMIAPVGPIVGRQQEIHTWVLAGRGREFMPFPQSVLVEWDERGCMVFRYKGDGTFCGDTWHQSLEEAQSQCSYEYGESIGACSSIPISVAVAHRFAIASVDGRRKE